MQRQGPGDNPITINTIWVGDPARRVLESLDTKADGIQPVQGHDTAGPILIANQLDAKHQSIFWCLDKHHDFYKNSLPNNIEVRSIEKFLTDERYNPHLQRPEVKEAASKVLAIMSEVLKEGRNRVRDRVTVKVIFSLFLQMTIGDYFLDSNIRPMPGTTLNLQRYNRFYRPYVDRVNEVWMMFSPTHDNSIARATLSDFYEHWIEAEEIYSREGYSAGYHERLSAVIINNLEKACDRGVSGWWSAGLSQGQVVLPDLGIVKYYFNTHRLEAVTYSRLHLAIDGDNIELLKVLLDKEDANQKINSKEALNKGGETTEIKETLLHRAIRLRKPEAMELLLQHGAKIDLMATYEKKSGEWKALDLIEEIPIHERKTYLDHYRKYYPESKFAQSINELHKQVDTLVAPFKNNDIIIDALSKKIDLIVSAAEFKELEQQISEVKENLRLSPSTTPISELKQLNEAIPFSGKRIDLTAVKSFDDYKRHKTNLLEIINNPKFSELKKLYELNEKIRSSFSHLSVNRSEFDKVKTDEDFVSLKETIEKSQRLVSSLEQLQRELIPPDDIFISTLSDRMRRVASFEEVDVIKKELAEIKKLASENGLHPGHELNKLNESIPFQGLRVSPISITSIEDYQSYKTRIKEALENKLVSDLGKLYTLNKEFNSTYPHLAIDEKTFQSVTSQENVLRLQKMIEERRLLIPLISELEKENKTNAALNDRIVRELNDNKVPRPSIEITSITEQSGYNANKQRSDNENKRLEFLTTNLNEVKSLYKKIQLHLPQIQQLKNDMSVYIKNNENLRYNLSPQEYKSLTHFPEEDYASLLMCVMSNVELNDLSYQVDTLLSRIQLRSDLSDLKKNVDPVVYQKLQDKTMHILTMDECDKLKTELPLLSQIPSELNYEVKTKLTEEIFREILPPVSDLDDENKEKTTTPGQLIEIAQFLCKNLEWPAAFLSTEIRRSYSDINQIITKLKKSDLINDASLMSEINGYNLSNRRKTGLSYSDLLRSLITFADVLIDLKEKKFDNAQMRSLLKEDTDKFKVLFKYSSDPSVLKFVMEFEKIGFKHIAETVKSSKQQNLIASTLKRNRGNIIALAEKLQAQKLLDKPELQHQFVRILTDPATDDSNRIKNITSFVAETLAKQTTQAKKTDNVATPALSDTPSRMGIFAASIGSKDKDDTPASTTGPPSPGQRINDD